MSSFRASLAAIAAFGAFALPAAAQDTFDGWLCCNLRTDGKWITDINYAESGKRVLAVGTPVRVTGYGRYRVHVEINGEKQAIGNDYSRDIPLPDFARRYVVTEDPSAKIAKFPPKIREAIRTARVAKGMTREQVAMAVGYPVSSENPNIEAPLWRMWLGSFSEFQVEFDANGRVSGIVADPTTRNLVEMD